MKPYAQMTDAEILDAAASVVQKLRERLVQVPADFDHHSEMFEADAEELRDLAAYIVENAVDICCDRMYFERRAHDNTYFADRSIADAMTADPQRGEQ